MRTLCSFRMLMQAHHLCVEVGGGESCKAILTLISADCAGIAGKRTIIEPTILHPAIGSCN